NYESGNVDVPRKKLDLIAKHYDVTVAYLFEGVYEELDNGAASDDYIFSYNFCPGETKIAARQVSDKWRKYIKNRLGIDKNFYLLKHLHTTKVITMYDRELAAGINGHKSTKMNDEHYDTLRDHRIIEEAKNIDVSL